MRIGSRHILFFQFTTKLEGMQMFALRTTGDLLITNQLLYRLSYTSQFVRRSASSFLPWNSWPSSDCILSYHRFFSASTLFCDFSCSPSFLFYIKSRIKIFHEKLSTLSTRFSTPCLCGFSILPFIFGPLEKGKSAFPLLHKQALVYIMFRVGTSARFIIRKIQQTPVLGFAYTS